MYYNKFSEELTSSFKKEIEDTWSIFCRKVWPAKTFSATHMNPYTHTPQHMCEGCVCVQDHAHKNLEATALYECQMDSRLDHDIYNQLVWQLYLLEGTPIIN